MADAQNERTSAGGRRRGRKGQRGAPIRTQVTEPTPTVEPTRSVLPASEGPEGATPRTSETTEFVRPADIAAPTERFDVYCAYHMALPPEHEPFNTRTNMTTLRHLAVDRFGGATLYCDCLHHGPHAWPPTLQNLETTTGVDQFATDSTSEA